MKRRILSASIFLIAALAAWTSARVGEPAPDLEGMIADIDETVRFVPSTRPTTPLPQRPPLSTPENTDTGRPVSQWQRLTDDWAGQRAQLDDRGVSVGLSSTGDLVKNLRGGANTEDLDFVHLTNLNLTFNTERLFNHPGGTLFVNYMHIGGDNPSNNVGDWQWVSSLSADRRRDQISELWYEQLFADGKVRLKFGKIDACAEFGVSDNAGEFLNASAGLSPVLPAAPVYPDSAGGVVVEWVMRDDLSIRLGVFDGSAAEGRTLGDDSLATFWGAPSDTLYLAELNHTWTLDGARSGRLALGGAFNSGTFDRFDGGTTDGAFGVYMIVDQTLVKEEPDNAEDQQGTFAHFRAAVGDRRSQDVHYHLGAGVHTVGLFPGRDDDATGLGVNYVHFSTASPLDDGELAIELFHKFQITRYFSIKPDLQYILNPGGIDQDDAIVAGVRFSLEY
jgi:porin